MHRYTSSECSTVDEKGEKISEEEAVIKYKDLLQTLVDDNTTTAMALGFAQLVVSGICIGLAAYTHDQNIAVIVNGISVPILLIPARNMLRNVALLKGQIKAVEDGKVSDVLDMLEELEAVHNDFEKEHGSGRKK